MLTNENIDKIKYNVDIQKLLKESNSENKITPSKFTPISTK